MAISMIRIDDRLVHGQIVAAWSKELGINRIWVVDDGVVGNAFVSQLMRMAAPSEVKVDITGTDEIEQRVAEYNDSQDRVLVLMKTPAVAKQLFDAGIALRELNVGGMGANASRSKLFKNISASDEEIATLQEIKDSGVDVYFRVTPPEKKTEFTGR